MFIQIFLATDIVHIEPQASSILALPSLVLVYLVKALYNFLHQRWLHETTGVDLILIIPLDWITARIAVDQVVAFLWLSLTSEFISIGWLLYVHL